MLIGLFRRDGDRFAGRLQTLTLDVPLRLLPATPWGAEKGPDWHVHLDDAAQHGDSKARVGAAWTRQSRNGDYVTLRIDCPALLQPIYASLWPIKDRPDEHGLYWSRPRQDRSDA